MKNTAVLTIFLVLLIVSSVHSQPTRPFQKTEQIILQGILQLGEFFGPPGYGEDPKKDRIEKSYYLQLPIPIDGEINLQRLRSSFNSDLLRGHFVQLVIFDFEKNPMEEKVGKMIKVTGTLFESHTGHHHTPVLMSVEKAELIDSYRW